jgi:hypothetical protein
LLFFAACGHGVVVVVINPDLINPVAAVLGSVLLLIDCGCTLAITWVMLMAVICFCAHVLLIEVRVSVVVVDGGVC